MNAGSLRIVVPVFSCILAGPTLMAAPKKPPTEYWMSVATGKTLVPGMPSWMDMVGAMLGGKMPGMG